MTIAEEAQRWLERLQTPTPEVRAAFTDWVMQSAQHLQAYLLARGFFAERSEKHH